MRVRALLTRNPSPPTQRGPEHEPKKPEPQLWTRAGANRLSRTTSATACVSESMLNTRSERVAQPVEHVTFNHGVLGSSPSALTKQTQQIQPHSWSDLLD